MTGFFRTGYTVRFAKSRDEVMAALRLRYEVFNLELNEGLSTSHAQGMDEDEFDAVCDHLVILESSSGAVVGTYRMQTGAMAARNLGFYSAREFDLSVYEHLRGEIVELGRACVHRDHRSIIVISLLWKELVRYAMSHQGRYMIGCSSLTSQDPALGKSMYLRFEREKHLVEEALRTYPMPDFALPEVEPLPESPPPPKLLRAYLGVGAKICAPPAIDREFKTIDFLTMIDCRNGSAIATERFVERPKKERESAQ